MAQLPLRVPCVEDTSRRYAPRQPEHALLHRLIVEHFEAFRREAASLRDGEGLPRFVEQEFRDFLTCGCLARGFARFHCDGCGRDQLVAFSCKGRGFCPSCGGRRMAERAAHLIDHVFPDVPVRQWVLSLPHRLRYQLAWDHDLCLAVVAVFMRAVLGWLRRRARNSGTDDGRGGAVAVIQRFGGALNLNIHVHALVLDGVFATDRAGRLAFRPTAPVAAVDVDEVLATVEAGVRLLIDRRGLLEDYPTNGSHDAASEDQPVLAGLAAAAMQGRTTFGRRRGARLERQGIMRDEDATPQLGECHARANGFDLHAGLAYPLGNGRGSSACVVTPCDRRWRRGGCT